MRPENIKRLRAALKLTPAEKRLWLEIARMRFYEEYITVRNLMRNLGYRSVGSTSFMLRALAQKGYLKPRPPGSHDTWQLFTWPTMDELRSYADGQR